MKAPQQTSGALLRHSSMVPPDETAAAPEAPSDGLEETPSDIAGLTADLAGLVRYAAGEEDRPSRTKVHWNPFPVIVTRGFRTAAHHAGCGLNVALGFGLLVAGRQLLEMPEHRLIAAHESAIRARETGAPIVDWFEGFRHAIDPMDCGTDTQTFYVHEAEIACLSQVSRLVHLPKAHAAALAGAMFLWQYPVIDAEARRHFNAEAGRYKAVLVRRLVHAARAARQSTAPADSDTDFGVTLDDLRRTP